MDEFITWIYSGGDVFMAQCKLLVVVIFLNFALMGISMLRDGMKASIS